MIKRSPKVQRTALLGLLFAVSLVLSWLESLLPALSGIPGVKLGLSNIAVMYALLSLDPPSALLLALLKAGFVLLVRGPTATLLSAAGGLASVAVMALCRRPAHGSPLLLSMLGAVTHNLAQLAAAALFVPASALLAYLPVLVLAGAGVGLLTGLTLKLTLAALRRITSKPLS